MWGIFYVPTGVYQTDKLLDVHRIHMLLGKNGGQPILNELLKLINDDMLSHKHIEEFRTLTYSNQWNDSPTVSVKRILNFFIDYRYRENVLDVLMNKFFPNERELKNSFYLTPDEIMRLHQAGMIVGSHSVNHRVMSKLSKEDQALEIRSSFDFLDRVTGGLPIRTFCYPYGGFHSFTKETEDLLTENGCAFSFNVEPRDISENDLKDRPQALPRYDCNSFPHGECRTS
jgi:peptidoglycan/xylan/chitin deacetylase (PgdA/CDA1 family)